MTECNRIAPKGSTWVCAACGKVARDQYGMEGAHSYGWDESCMLNAVLTEEARWVTKLEQLEYEHGEKITGR